MQLSEEHAHHERSTDNVAYGYRYQIIEHIAQRDVCTFEYSGWNEEHVGNAVLITENYERCHRHPACNHLGRESFHHEAEPYSQAYAPVGGNPLDE